MAGGLQHLDGAVNIDGHVVRRPLDGRNDVADTREVEGVAGAAERAIVRGQRADVALVQVDVGIARVMGQVGRATTHEVVDDVHAEPLVGEQIDHMAADEAGAAGHDHDRPRRHAARVALRVATLK